ncbi:MAG: hypothetical protein WBB19_13435 [Desulforhopalus sp.]
MNPLIYEVMIEEKRRDMLKEAARQQIITIYNAKNPSRQARMLLALGNFLIRLGERVKRRSTRSLNIGDDFCRE